MDLNDIENIKRELKSINKEIFWIQVIVTLLVLVLFYAVRVLKNQ